MPYRLQAPHSALRRTVFFALILGTSAAGIARMGDILGSDGLSTAETAVVVLFGINFLWISVSFYAALAGLWLRATGRDAVSLRRNAGPQLPTAPLQGRTAVLFPVYNEDPQRVFAGLAATYQNLPDDVFGRSFDFFVLSDTRDPDQRIEELLTFVAARDRLNAHDRLFYRHRPENTEKKPGNIAEFCERWGNAYDYMVVCDADSVMAGDTLIRMAHLMETHPKVGLIQTAPIPTGCGTLFARIQQFISRVHGPTMSAGLAFWTLRSGNYWGHNAIIRMQSFIRHCGLPILSGKPPFGGPVTSHDFIEAAMLRRAGLEVWLLPAPGGSWEELPSNVLSYASRDRRWCRGNLQHLRFLTAPGFNPVSRLHLFMGIMSYVSSPLWFLLLIASSLTAYESAVTGQAFFPDPHRFFPVWPVSRAFEMTVLILLTLGMLTVPKLCSAALIAARKDEARRYGGALRLWQSMLGELVFSALLAPAMMVFHTKFVLGAFNGAPTAWESQVRGDEAVSFALARRAQGGTVVLGLVWGALAYAVMPAFFAWMLPVLTGLVLSVPLSVQTSRPVWRSRFQTPEETAPPEELQLLQHHLAIPFIAASEAPMIERLLADPRAVALHRASLPTRLRDAAERTEIELIIRKLQRLGAQYLSRDEKLKLLAAPADLFPPVS